MNTNIVTIVDHQGVYHRIEAPLPHLEKMLANWKSIQTDYPDIKRLSLSFEDGKIMELNFPQGLFGELVDQFQAQVNQLKKNYANGNLPIRLKDGVDKGSYAE